jgi:hypothetical protein
MIGMEVDSLDEPVSEASIYHQMVLARYGGYYPTSKRNSDSSARASKCWPHALVGRREQPLPVGGIPEFFLVTKSVVACGHHLVGTLAASIDTLLYSLTQPMAPSTRACMV